MQCSCLTLGGAVDLMDSYHAAAAGRYLCSHFFLIYLALLSKLKITYLKYLLKPKEDINKLVICALMDFISK